MSWLARSIVNSLRGEEEEEEEDDDSSKPNTSSLNRGNEQQEGVEDEDGDPSRGVKEDLSELTKTLTRQFWGVASFLAPPPAEDPGQRSDPAGGGSDEPAGSPRLAGIRSDFAEIAGRFKSGISMLSTAKAVAEISKIGSTLLPFGSEEDEAAESDGAVGVTDEVVAFARNVSVHPETWLDFPSIPDEGDSDDFDMSDAQQEHALAVERLAPTLAALRIELCPSHISEERFWKIYFVLLHSRLNRSDADILTTPQIVQARAALLQDLQNRGKPKSEPSSSGGGVTSQPTEEVATVPVERDVISASEAPTVTSSIKALSAEDEPSNLVQITDVETEKHPVEAAEVEVIDKSVIEEDPPAQAKSKNKDASSDASSAVSIQKFQDDGDDWLEEEETGEAGVYSAVAAPLGNDEDVSFSDLEEDNDEAPQNSRKLSPLNKGSSDWLTIDGLEDV